MKGVYSVLPTPFTASGEVDYESLRRVIALFVNAGVDGLTVLGVTSESNKLTPQEKTSILETVFAEVGGKVPLIVGTTAEGTEACVEASRAAKKLGAYAVMISPPRMPKLNSDAVVSHYKTVGETVDLRIVIQDYPPVSGFSMEPSLLVRIAREVSLARTIKMEDPPTPLKTSRILKQTDGLVLDILGGLGGMYLFEELLAGAAGVMTGFAYPELLVEIVRLYKQGKAQESADLFYRFVALMRFEFQEGIGMAIRKEMLHRRGVFATSLVRPPGIQMDEATSGALTSLIDWIKQKEHPAWI